MYGIIRKSDWDYGQSPVDVILTSPTDFAPPVAADCSNPEDAWDRNDVQILRPIDLTCNDSGETVPAFVCRRR
jgi:hypothetical protein